MSYVLLANKQYPILFLETEGHLLAAISRYAHHNIARLLLVGSKYAYYLMIKTPYFVYLALLRFYLSYVL